MDEVVDQDPIMDKAKEKASDLSTMGHPSYSMTKELFIADALKKINDMRGANDKHKAVKYIFAKPENLAKFIKDKESY
mgnify:CR=1 FL=1